MNYLFEAVEPYLYFLVPVIEIIIIAVFFYFILNSLRGTRSAFILVVTVFFLILTTLVFDLLKFEVLSWLLNGLWTFFPVALIVIFHREIRRALALISTPFGRSIKREETISEIITAVINLSKKKHGALIAIEQGINLRGITDNYIKIDAKLNHNLIETIFYPETPLHDGGVIIRRGEIMAASCIFPLSNNPELTRNMGTRHRAALGITEETDALVVVVSEETGSISIAYKGNIKRNIKLDKIRRYLEWLVDEGKPFTFKDLVEEEEKSKNEDSFVG